MSAELVIATPLLLLLILLVVQFALWQHAAHVVEAAAQEGLAATRVEGGSEIAGSTQAQAVLSHLGRSVVVDPQVHAVRTVDVARVEVTGHAEPVVPFMQLPVRAVAQGPVERFRAPVGAT